MRYSYLHKPVVRDPEVIERFTVAFELAELAEQMVLQNLRRRYPEENEAEILKRRNQLYFESRADEHLDTHIRRIPPEVAIRNLRPRLERTPSHVKAVEMGTEAELERLALSWKDVDPEQIARLLAGYEEEARLLHRSRTHWNMVLGRALAPRVAEPVIWLRAFLDRELPPLLVLPLLARTVESRAEGWEALLGECLAHESYRQFAASVVLELSEPPPDLLQAALLISREIPQLIEASVSTGKVPTPTLRLLLQHEDLGLALAAAFGESHRTPQGEIRPEIEAEWRRAILRSAEPSSSLDQHQSYWLGAILRKELALDWLAAHLRDPAEEMPLAFAEVIVGAILGLSQEDRLQLLELPSANLGRLGSKLSLLIGDNSTLYRALLEREDARNWHLKPLERTPDAAWAELAQLAYEHDHEPGKIAAAGMITPGGWGGHGVRHWMAKDQAFAALESDPREGIRAIARQGRAMAQKELEKAEAEKQQTELHGLVRDDS